MSRDPSWPRWAVAATVFAAVVHIAGCGPASAPGASSAASPSPDFASAAATRTGPPASSLSEPSNSSAGAVTPERAPRLSNGLPVAVPAGYVVESAGGDVPVLLSRGASIISVAASDGADPEIIASNVLTGAQQRHMVTDVRQAGTVRYAPTGHATGETMIGYSATLHVGQTSTPVEGAAVGIVRDDGRAVRVMWMETPGTSSQYSSAYRDLLISLTR